MFRGEYKEILHADQNTCEIQRGGEFKMIVSRKALRIEQNAYN